MLVVLDLNGTLCATSFQSHERTCARPHDGRARAKYFWIRPHARAFVTQLLDSGHSVAVWTSCPRRNAEPLARGVLGDALFARLAFLYAREECTLADDGTHGSFKDMRTVRAPAVLVDDSPEKAVADGYIAIPTYGVCTCNADDDPALHQRIFDACLADIAARNAAHSVSAPLLP